MGVKGCKDCGPESKRPAPKPGPRCVTHWREFEKARKRKAHGRYIQATYGIRPEAYWAIYDYQGGKCYMCERATGKAKNLSVDHDHACCNGPKSCGKCVRGLLCGPCNKGVLGHLRDDKMALRRGIEYLTNPPARYVLDELGHTKE